MHRSELSWNWRQSYSVLAALLVLLVVVLLQQSAKSDQDSQTVVRATNGAATEDGDEARMVAAPRESAIGGTPYAALIAADKQSADTVAPAFTLPDLLDEKTIHALAAYQGWPVILNFWASWCVPCRREMPALQAVTAQHRADGLVLLGMNQTYLDNLEAARAFVEDLSLTFPNTRDDNGAVGKHAYQIVGLPTTVFVDRDGAIVHIQVGEMSQQQVASLAEQLMAGEPLRP